jgi:hypothetical protein
MKKSDEHARRGFELLLKRKDFERFFDALNAEGFFDPAGNPAPITIDSGSVRIPYWAPLDYLIACAKQADENVDAGLANKVMSVIRTVSAAREPDGSFRDNYFTARKFAEILGLLPTNVISLQDIDFVQFWLKTKFNRGMVAHALDAGAFKRFLESADPKDWAKAVKLLHYCTEIQWDTEKGREEDDKQAVSIVDDYWLKELIKHHAVQFGKRAPSQAAAVFEQRIREVFGQGGRAKWSYVYRPAVEEHGQNHSWKGVENALVQGLRDVVLGWCDVELPGATKFVEGLLHSDIEMLRRIGIYVLAERWSALRDLYLPIVASELFDSNNIHEVYDLLARRFEEFDEKQKTLTIEAIRGLAVPDGEDAEQRLQHVQRRWLSAIWNTMFKPAAEWIAEIKATTAAGVPEHPNFNSYFETFSGPGPSPYQVQELVAFAQEGSIVGKLNSFRPETAWRGPSVEALVETLEQAIQASPETFIRTLPHFVDAARPYQHGIIRGFKSVWDASKEKQLQFDWDNAWTNLIDFLEKVVGKPGFWEKSETGDREYTASWNVSAIADFLEAGSRNDDHAYPASLMPRTWSLLQILLENAEATAAADDNDPMTRAINTAKGRSIEALYSHALRACRLSDKGAGSHGDAWAEMKDVFEAELSKCEKGNYEFSTLSGAYLANLDYMNGDWLRKNIGRIFPADRPGNFSCAISGLAYSHPTRRTYVMLREAGVIDNGLRMELKGRETRKKLVEQVALAYLWGDETLDSPRFSYLFASGLVEDLEDAAWFFWSIRGDTLTDAQTEKIIDFWERCMLWAKKQKTPPAKMMSSLGHLTWSMKNAAGRNRDLLLAVAPYMHVHHNTYELLEELARLVDANPAEVSEVLRKLIETGDLTYDYEDRLRTLVKRLAALGRRADALEYCDRLRNVPGMFQLFQELNAAGP